MKIFSGVLCSIDANDIDLEGVLDLTPFDISIIGNNMDSISNDAKVKNSVKSVILSDSTDKIGNFAFQEFENLETINLENITDIGMYAFFKDKSLEDVEATCLINLDEGAFAECDSLKSFVSGDELTSVAPACFQLCGNLKHFYGGDSLTSIGNYAFNYTGIVKFVNESVDEIGISAFAGCPHLDFVKVSDYAKIGNHAFANSSITEFYSKHATLEDDSFADTILEEALCCVFNNEDIDEDDEDKDFDDFLSSDNIF